MNSTVYDLTAYNGDLYAGGLFNNAGGVTANYIARWNGTSWSRFRSGMNSPVNTFAVQNGSLYAGGNFSTAGTLRTNGIAGWDGTSWSALGSGMNYAVLSLTIHDGDLYAGGAFTTAGGLTANGIARWDGTAWSPLGSGMGGIYNYVYALAAYNGDLYAGGAFTTAGGITANHIARWDGTSWSPLGSGMNGTVLSLAVYEGDLYAGGAFTTAGGVTANYIARWDGTSWSPLGSGMNAEVHALAVNNGNLYAGGAFTAAGGVTANYITRWDGTSWSALGNGMDSYVKALTVHNGYLYAGGYFATAGGVTANHIARWNGIAWSPLGSGMNSLVYALTIFNSDLYAGGAFTTAGGNVSEYIACANYNPGGTVALSADPETLSVTLTGSGWYSFGTEVNISTSPGKEYLFVEWAGSPEDAALLSDPASSSTAFIMPDRDVNLTAVYLDFYDVAIFTEPSDIGIIVNGAGQYSVGTEVNISTSPGKEYLFVEWTGSPEDVALLSDPASSSTSFIMPDRDVNLTAVYLDFYDVAIFTEPSDIGIIVNGAGQYSVGTEVNISTSPGKEYLFVEWAGSPEDVALLSDPASSSASFIMPDRDVNLTAVYLDFYDVALLADPDNIGIVLAGAGEYSVGYTVDISASLSKAYQFQEWAGSPEDVALLSDPASSSTAFIMPGRDVIFTAVYIDPVPAAPAGLQANTVSYSQIDLSWIDNSHNETGFRIDRSKGIYGKWAQIAEVGANTTYYQDTGLLDDTTYCYRVRAFNENFHSDWSDTDCAETDPSPYIGVLVYRFFNHVRGGHLYTISEIERDYIIENMPDWTYEGPKFKVYEDFAPLTAPAYRFFNAITGIHFYTISEDERDTLMQLPEWNYEGIKFYVHENYAEETVPVFRFFNHLRGGHLYTISEIERDAVMQLPEWTYEGIPFYVLPLELKNDKKGEATNLILNRNNKKGGLF